MKKPELDAGGLAFTGANDDTFHKPGITIGAGLKKRSAAEIVGRGLNRSSRGKRRHHFRRTVAKCDVADIDQRAVIGAQRIARFKFRHAVVPNDLPVGAARKHRTAQFRAGKIPADDRDDTPAALAHIAKIDRRIDLRMRGKNELKQRNDFASAMAVLPKRLINARNCSDNRPDATASRCKTCRGVAMPPSDHVLFPTTIAGSLPKPSWLAEPNKLWAPWRLDSDELQAAKNDATLLALKLQEDAGIDIVADGEQARQHFVHGFLEAVEGIDFGRRVQMGIRNNRYKAMCPTVIGPLRLRTRVHAQEARLARAHTRRKLKLTLPGPMTIVDTIADAHYGDRIKMAMAFAALLNEEARGLAADGVDVIQFDEPAFNVYMDEAAGWGIEALHRAIDGVAATSVVHICYGYGIPANIAWKATLGGEWRQYEKFFPALARSRIDQVSVECINSHVPLSVLKLLDGKDVQIGAIDVATDDVESPEQVAAVIGQVAEYVPKEKIIAGTNCGMAPMHRDIAVKKLEALAKGAALAREKFG